MTYYHIKFFTPLHKWCGKEFRNAFISSFSREFSGWPRVTPWFRLQFAISLRVQSMQWNMQDCLEMIKSFLRDPHSLNKQHTAVYSRQISLMNNPGFSVFCLLMFFLMWKLLSQMCVPNILRIRRVDWINMRMRCIWGNCLACFVPLPNNKSSSENGKPIGFLLWGCLRLRRVWEFWLPVLLRDSWHLGSVDTRSSRR